MKTCLILAVLGMAALVSAGDSLQAFVAGNHRLSSKLYREMAKIERGNFLVCPISLEVIMALVLTGARGDTAAELSQGLELPNDKNQVEAQISSISSNLDKSSLYTLRSANKAYIKEKLVLNPDFKKTAVQVFKSDVENVDFSQKEATSNKINQWVESKTNNLIKNLIQPDSIDQDTVMVLVNALYFKGDWQSQFSAATTYPDDFYTSKNEKIKVKMMSQTSSFNYYEDKGLKAKFLEMPYTGGEVSMTIVLPDEVDGLKYLEQNIEKVFEPKPFTKERVYVKMPLFTMESSIKMKEILQNMGIKKVFSNGADLSGMAPNLRVDKVIQKTFINVTEDGTEAAAATAVGSVNTSAIPRPDHSFEAKRPFLYLIRTVKGICLFIGKTVKFSK